MRVGAADPERGHPGPARPAAGGPGHRLGQQPHRRRPTSPRAGTARRRAAWPGSTPCCSASTILITPATPAAAWVCPMFDFTEPSHSGRSCRPVLPVGGEQRLRLDRVAERGPGPVRLHRVHLGRRDSPRAGQRGPDHPLLRRAVRRGQPVGRAVLVHRAARAPPPAPGARCAARPTAAPARTIPAPSASPIPSAAARERLAPAVRRPAPRCRENSDERRRGRHHRHPAGQRQRRTPPPAAPGRPGAAPPATTSTPCPPSPPGPPGRARTTPGRRSRWSRSRSAGSPPAPPSRPAAVARRRPRRRTPRSGEPRSDAGSIPARSSASQDTSSSSRCCGSIASASRGLIPKNPASNSAASCTNPPWRAYEVPA